MTRKKKRKSNNPDGRPSHGLTETSIALKMPEELLAAATERAAVEGVSRTEWIRAAMRARLATT